MLADILYILENNNVSVSFCLKLDLERLCNKVAQQHELDVSHEGISRSVAEQNAYENGYEDGKLEERDRVKAKLGLY
jgi:hypothetical protein